MSGSMRPDIGYPRGVIRPARVPPRPLSGLAELLGVGRTDFIPNGPGRLTGVTLDSRQVRAGDLYAALPGEHTHGAAYCDQAVAAGRDRHPHRPGRPGPGGPHRRAGVRGVRAAGPARRHLLLDLRRPVAPDDDDRGDRDKRQDDHQLPGRGRAARGRARDRAGRRGGDQDRCGAGRLGADHAGGAGPAGAARRHGGAPRDGGRDGGVQPFAGARPGGRHPVRRGGVHQPVAGPPGLPRRVRGLLQGEGEAVHPAVRRDRRAERGRQVRQAPGGGGVGACRHVLRRSGVRRLPERGLAGRRRALRRGRLDVPGDRARRGGGGRVGDAARRVQRGQRARRDRGARRGRLPA